MRGTVDQHQARRKGFVASRARSALCPRHRAVRIFMTMPFSGASFYTQGVLKKRLVGDQLDGSSSPELLRRILRCYSAASNISPSRQLPQHYTTGPSRKLAAANWLPFRRRMMVLSNARLSYSDRRRQLPGTFALTDRCLSVDHPVHQRPRHRRYDTHLDVV